MSLLRVRVAVLVVLSVVAPATPAAAQSAGIAAPADTAAVPRELVAALFGGVGPAGAAAAPEITVGRLPDGFPAEAVLANAAVLGGLSTPRGSARSTRPSTVVLRVPLPPAEALAASERQLAGTGWRPAAALSPRGGFVPGPPGRPAMFCRDSASLTVWAAPRPEGGSHLRLSLLPGTARFTPCGRGAALPDAPDVIRMDPGPIPTLQAPPGAATLGGGSTGGVSMGGSDAREASTRLDVALAPTALVAHYAVQLQAAGWTLGAPLAAGGVAAQAAERRDAAGRSWQGLLSAVALPGTREREIVFRVVRPADAPGR